MKAGDITPVFIAIQHHMVVRAMPFMSAAVADWANTALTAETVALSDGLPTFRALRAETADHTVHVAGSGKPAVANPEFKWVNVILEI